MKMDKKTWGFESFSDAELAAKRPKDLADVAELNRMK